MLRDVGCIPDMALVVFGEENVLGLVERRCCVQLLLGAILKLHLRWAIIGQGRLDLLVVAFAGPVLPLILLFESSLLLRSVPPFIPLFLLSDLPGC